MFAEIQTKKEIKMENTKSKVVFINCFGKTIVPDRYFENIREADEYALEHDLDTVCKIKDEDIKNLKSYL
jgi:hypothetical protein